MASLYKKVISGKPYWYLREMGWVDGKPKLVSERYLGTAADIAALLDAREAAVLPERTRHLAFGDVAAAWGMLQDLGVAAVIDEVTGARRADPGGPAGRPLGRLGLVVTRDGGIPLTWHAYPGDRPDVTQFPDMIDQLKTRYEAVCAAAGLSAEAADMTVVFDAGQNSEANFAHLAGAGLQYIGSVPASDCPDLTALPASVRTIVGKDRFGGLTPFDTRRTV